jgi:hypothetical protein
MRRKQIRMWGLAILAIFGVAIAQAQTVQGPKTQLNTYEETAAANCPNSFQCTVYFKEVPAAIQIVKVSCYYGFSGAAVLTSLTLGDSDVSKTTYNEWDYLPPGQYVVLTLTANAAETLSRTNHVVVAGSLPTIRANFGGYTNSSMTCSITANK